MKFKIKYFITVLFIVIINIIIVSFLKINIGKDNMTLCFDVLSAESNTYQVFYSKNDEWNEQESVLAEYGGALKKQTLTFVIPSDTARIRIDVGNKVTSIQLSNLILKQFWNKVNPNIDIDTHIGSSIFNIEEITQNNGVLNIITKGNDPNFILQFDYNGLESLNGTANIINAIFKILICILLSSIMLIIVKKIHNIKAIVYSVYGSKNLIWNLAKNDFKTKYAGSYLGITWAFVQPIVIVLVYWFVFQIGFKSAPMDDFPFILWLVAGIVPWFYFQEAITNATNSMLEYSYLVKKVVFKISVLPMVKVISALFVHGFFILFTIGLFSVYGYYPNIYTIQVVYYSFCTAMLVLSISYATSSIIIFFKDLGQIVGILLQIGMWMTPILWSYTMLPEKYQWLLKINPLYYIIEGYRDSLIRKVWLWEKLNLTIYFWVVTIILLGIGTIIFKKLKVHFADVL